MRNLCLKLATLLFVAALMRTCVANDAVPGPPTWIIDAQIEADGPRGQSKLIGTVLDWNDTRQSWTESGALQHGGRTVGVSRARSRSVLMLHSDQFVASMAALRFSRLDGSEIKSNDLPGLLNAQRAVVFLPKGTGIHPAIVAALHPETIVITRVSYPSDPVVIPLPEVR